MKEKSKFKNEAGITLLTLGIMIAVILIIASSAMYSAGQARNSAKKTEFTTELKIMQAQVNMLYTKWKNGEEIIIKGSKISPIEIGYKIDGNTQTQAEKALEGAGVITEEEKEKYRYYDASLIKDLNIEGVTQEFLINVEDRKVVSYRGLTIGGETCYVLEGQPDDLYNVQYEEKDIKPTFDVEIDDKGKVEIQNIKDNNGITKWQVKYRQKKDSETTWQTSDKLTFYVKEKGEYEFKIVNGNIESDPYVVTVN